MNQDDLEPARFFFVGQRVYIPWRTPEHPTQGLRCIVVTASGETARIVNPTHGVDRWVRAGVDEVLVEKPDPYCEVCGLAKTVVPDHGPHDFHDGHKQHVVLNRRARDGWVPLANTMGSTAKRLGKYTEYEGARKSGGNTGIAPMEFVRVEDAEDMVGSVGAESLCALLFRTAIDAQKLVAAENVPWRVAVTQVSEKGDFVPLWWL